jgi:hypothetical protein
MMHGHGKSDPVVVATKPANNAEPSAAEPQNRENVSQARISQVWLTGMSASKMKFTFLLVIPTTRASSVAGDGAKPRAT